MPDGWRVQFADREVAVEIGLPHSWEDEPERLAYSGAATYTRTVEVPELEAGAAVMIDFGDARTASAGPAEVAGLRGHSYRVQLDPPVGVVAEVRVNKINCGVVWAPPYVVDLTRAVRPGSNQVEVTVYNTAANALAHDPAAAAMTADAERLYGPVGATDWAADWRACGIMASRTGCAAGCGARAGAAGVA